MSSPIPIDVAHLPELLDDLDHAVAEMTAGVRDQAIWTVARPGHWTVGQHVEHSARLLAMSALEFERASDALALGQLPGRPWRDPIQGIFVRVITGKRFPRGSRSPSPGRPSSTPDRSRALHDLEEGARRHRIVADRLPPEARERIWIWNPYAPKLRWHYTLPEIVRVQANHVRHHLLLVNETLSSTIGSRT